MTRREGETEQGSEVSEGPEETLEDYREGINEKYAEDGEKKDESGEASGEGDVKKEKEPAGNSEGNDAAESESGKENFDKAPERQAGDSSQTGSQEGQEAQRNLSETNAGREDIEPKEEPPSDEKTSGGEELESMREHLNEKYPGNENDVSEREETQPAIPPADEKESGVDPPEPNPAESSKQQNAEANGVSTEGQTDTPTNNAAERPEHDLSAQEDVGWRTPEGHATPDKPQDPPKSDEIQPNEVGSPHAAVENGDSKQPQNESKEESAKPAETSPSDEAQAGRVESAKADTNDQSASDKPLADTGKTDGESPDNPLQIHAEKQVERTSGSDNARDLAGAKAEEERSSFEGQDTPRAEAKGGGNQLPERDEPTSAKNGSPEDLKDVRKEGGEADDQQPIVRQASNYMASTALIIPDRVIPDHENRDDVYEVRISRISKPEEEYKVYMTHNPDYERAYLPTRHVGAEKGEEFYVRRPEKYEEGNFARDYNANKPKGLENTSLEWNDGKFVLKVDGAELALKEAKMRAQEGKVVLDAKLNDEDKNTVKIAKGVDGVDFRLKSDHAAVTSMKESKQRVTVTYQRTQNDNPPHARGIEISREGRSELREWRHEFKMDLGGVSMDRPLECRRDTVVVHMSRETGIEAGTYWARHEAGQKWHQGDIGEEVAGCLLEQSGFKTIREHTIPIKNRVPVHKSENYGMDRLVEKEGKNYAVQVKHWLDAQKALDDARKDISNFAKSSERSKLEEDLGTKFEGGLAIEVHWSYQKQEAIIYTDYIKF